jgi:hypothetical protein
MTRDVFETISRFGISAVRLIQSGAVQLALFLNHQIVDFRSAKDDFRNKSDSVVVLRLLETVKLLADRRARYIRLATDSHGSTRIFGERRDA